MLLIFIMYLLFASTFTLGKAALAYVTPFLFIAIRMICAGGLLLGYSIARKQCRIAKHDYPLFIRIMIFHIFFAYTLEFWALEHITSTKACLLYNLSPFITAVLSYGMHKERFTLQQFIGLMIGFVGFLPILIEHTPLEMTLGSIAFFSWYEIGLIASVVSSAYGWMLVKRLTHKGYPFIFINAVGMTGGGILSLCLSLLIDKAPALKHAPIVLPAVAEQYGVVVEHSIMLAAYSICIIIIANIIGYNLYAYLLSQYSATFLSFAGFTTPIFAAILGSIFLKETVTWHFFATMIAIIIGLYIFNQEKLKHSTQ